MALDSSAASTQRKAEWAARHPERYAMYGRTQQLNKRASRALVPGRLTTEDGFWIEERDGKRCVFCGSPSTEFDHGTPLSRGGWNCTWNVQCVCRPCNARKASRTNEEFIANVPTSVCRNGHVRTLENTRLGAGGRIKDCRDCETERKRV